MEMQFEMIGYSLDGTKWGDLRTVEAPTKEEAFRKVHALAKALYGPALHQIWAGREGRGTLVQALLGDLNGHTVGEWNILDGDVLNK